MKYPPLSDGINHNPRPTTRVLETVRTVINMSTSPRLPPQTGLELPSDSALRAILADYPQFILFGDSITQFGTLTLQAYLQTEYIRRLDVINRGLSGFTLPMGLMALQKFLPATSPESAWPKIKLVTVFFGANDACVPGESQHVGLQSYIDAFKKVIDYPVFNRKGALSTKIVIITPPPVNEHQFERKPAGGFQRRAGITSQYARAAREVGKAYGAPVLDFWTILMTKVGWNASMGCECCCDRIPCHVDMHSRMAPDMQHIPGCFQSPSNSPDFEYQLSDFLADGLHLSKLGYDVLFSELLKLIREEIPDCAPENLPFVLPEWRAALKMPEYCA